jgi:antitoxin ParD1/3/4/toxin ParE1/3/4
MSRFKLSTPARQDLREIRDYIAQDNIPAARNFLAKLTQAFRGIAEMPNKGHPREDLTDLPVRFWPVGSYLIVYDPKKRPIEILRVLHGARNVETILENQ